MRKGVNQVLGATRLPSRALSDFLGFQHLNLYFRKRGGLSALPVSLYVLPLAATPPTKDSSIGVPMITAIVLIKAQPQRIAECATKLAGIDGVSQVYSVSGEWDLVAMIEVAEHEAIARIVTEHVTVVPGIKSTHTLTSFRAYSKKDLEQAWDIGLE
jgi:DNA-binding Lrp family transcriptional regulator